jgi:hypothetical protein
LTQSDPTDGALATIAGSPDHSQSPRATEGPATASPPIAPVEADGYTKIGPGPMAAIRFKWTVRRGENDEYFVDETIGESLAAVVVGPMSADAAIKLVDERERNARRRFEQIRSEMIGRSVALSGASKGNEA